MKRPKLTHYLAPFAALAAAGIVAVATMLTPSEWLERIVTAGGLPDWLPQASPPLGAKARALIAFGTGCVAALAAFGAALLFDLYRRRNRRTALAPLSMVELGLLAPSEVEEVAPVACAEVEEIEPVAPALADEQCQAAYPPPESVTALVDRLERGLMRRRAGTPVELPEPTNVDDALRNMLGELRQLAVQR